MTHLRTTFAIAYKDVGEILVNRPTVVMLLTPVFLALMFGVLSGLLGGQSAKMLIYNPENSGIGQAVARSLPESQVTVASFPDEVTSAFAAGKNSPYSMGMIVPPDFDASLERGEHPQLTLYFNDNRLNAVQRQPVISAINDYATGISHALPTVIITPSASDPISILTQDLSTFYVAMALLASINIGISLVSTMLVEEKEHKTLRMLLISPATIVDVVSAKLVVGVVYQIVLSLVVMAMLRGFVGNLPLVFVFVLFITGFGLALSLLAGSIFQSTSGLGGFLSIVSLLFVIPVVFAGPLGAFFQNALLHEVLHLLPTYYMGDGLLNALQNQSALGDVMLDLGITIGATVICLTAAVWILHRQTAVTAAI